MAVPMVEGRGSGVEIQIMVALGIPDVGSLRAREYNREGLVVFGGVVFFGQEGCAARGSAVRIDVVTVGAVGYHDEIGWKVNLRYTYERGKDKRKNAEMGWSPGLADSNESQHIKYCGESRENLGSARAQRNAKSDDRSRLIITLLEPSCFPTRY